MSSASHHSVTQCLLGKVSDLTASTIDVLKPAMMVVILTACNSDPAADSHELAPGLGIAFLLSDAPLAVPLPTREYMPTKSSARPLAGITGVLSLVSDAGQGNIEVLADQYSVADSPQWKLTELPPFSFEFVSDGSEIIPLKQTPQRSNHPYWEIILGPGSAWSEAGDGGWSRASLPFALKEKNQNCTHNGMMTFAYKADGTISRVVWQVSSETCLYLKINLWGVMPASYQPMAIAGTENIIASHRKTTSARMPVKTFNTLATDYPQVDIATLSPPGIEDSTVYGFVIDGTHYRGGCQTRHGPYPYCDVLILPSYSLAKSIFAGLFFLRIARQWPEFISTAVSELVPECKLPDGRWDDVTMSHLINMTSGNYDRIDFGMDEAAEKMQKFFLAERHTEKIAFSCKAWPRKSLPGHRVVYHTTDDYILGVAISAFIREKSGPEVDMHRDYFYPTLLEPLNLSPLMRWTQRTYDKAAQPFTAFGLEMHADDLIRIAGLFSITSSEQPFFDQEGLEQAMFRDSNNLMGWLDDRGTAYRNGFWGQNASEWINCQKETWIPFMSGYGGITVALIPNGTIFYNFSDSDNYRFQAAAMESNKIRDYCER